MVRAMEPPRASTLPIVLSQQRPTRHGPRRSTAVLPAAPPGRLCYDVRAHEPRGRAPGQEDMGWTLSRWWTR
jgi:hypothetical protein